MKKRKEKQFLFDTLRGIIKAGRKCRLNHLLFLSTLYWVVVTPVLMMANYMCYKCVEKSILVELPPLQLAALCCSNLVEIRQVEEPGKWIFEVSDDSDQNAMESLEKLTELAKDMLDMMGFNIIPWDFRIVTTSRWQVEKKLDTALANS